MHGMHGIGGFIHEIIYWRDICKKSDVHNQKMHRETQSNEVR
jgi:hypothetical protein